MSAFGRSVKNAAVDLATLDRNEIQLKADQLYNDFVEEFKKKVDEIISEESAGTTAVYVGWN